MSAITTRRHFALRHRLAPAEALESATPVWVTARIHHYAAAVGVTVSALTDVGEYQGRTGRGVSERCWGDADWAGAERLVYVDPAKCATKGRAEVVIAHEVGHHAWRSYRHRVVFWARVQALLDRVGGRPAGVGEATLEAGETSSASRGETNQERGTMSVKRLSWLGVIVVSATTGCGAVAAGGSSPPGAVPGSVSTPSGASVPGPPTKTARCHQRGADPDPDCTPGAVNSAVTQASIHQTICLSGFTKTIRPLVAESTRLKRLAAQAYGITDNLSAYEGDHVESGVDS